MSNRIIKNLKKTVLVKNDTTQIDDKSDEVFNTKDNQNYISKVPTEDLEYFEKELCQKIDNTMINYKKDKNNTDEYKLFVIWKELKNNSSKGYVVQKIQETYMSKTFISCKNVDLLKSIWRRFRIRLLNNNGSYEEKLDLFQLVTGLVLISKNPIKHKLTMLFTIHDADEDNCLTPSEIKRLIKNVDLFNYTDKQYDSKNDSEIKSAILVANVALCSSERRLIYVMEGPGALSNKLQDMTDLNNDQSDSDQLLDINQINDAFQKMNDLETKWIAPLGKSLRNILGNVDYDEPKLNFSEDMYEKANQLRNHLHFDLLFKNYKSNDFVYKDSMPISLNKNSNICTFLNNTYQKQNNENNTNLHRERNNNTLDDRNKYTDQVLNEVKIKCDALNTIKHIKLNNLDGGI